MEAAGFIDVTCSERRYDTFSDAPSASSAAEFGTQGVDIWAAKRDEGGVGSQGPVQGLGARGSGSFELRATSGELSVVWWQPSGFVGAR
ncbi:MAG: hypothetical protein KatS3mg059_0997 [Thermomicrobiales bacterium]|nr:MAG: hypothetical protein KatS3mg059_0997 [Thermomicrobiales bacterium]